MPRIWIFVGLFLGSAALVPLALLYRAQATPSTTPRLQVIPDMDSQGYHRAQSGSAFFADGRAMRRPVEGTLRRGEPWEDDAFVSGKIEDAWVAGFPGGLDAERMARGRERFAIYCAPCHGDGGRGDGMVARRAAALAEGTWTPPSDLTAKGTVTRPEGELFHIVGHGIRTMPPYAAQIAPADRWAIVAYLRALQRSAHGRLEDVPQDLRARIR